MSRNRLLGLLAGAGLVLAALPAAAASSSGTEAQAQSLLQSAARAATTRSWSGTQYVGTWRGSLQTSAVVDVVHRPGSGSTVRTQDGEQGVLSPDLDARLLTLLADHYDLAVAGSGRIAGRAARVVEARRAGTQGAGSVAGRFWLDAATGLVLRREVYDLQGRRMRSSAYVDVRLGGVEQPVPAAPAVPGSGTAATVTVPSGGWLPPRELPGGLQLFDAQVRTHDGGRVLHLAYSDGLSTLSVFSQPGGLPGRLKGFRAQRLQGTDAWVQDAAPERVVWQGEGHLFTLVSDASPATVRDAVAALPRDAAARGGVLGRLGRGLGRLLDWVNPFD